MQQSLEAQHRRLRRLGGFLSRLKRNQRGNTLALAAAALVPLMAMIGSGVEMSRAYMVKTRLQSACDAASLAGRRVMTNDTLSSQVTAEANKFFTFNFPAGLYGTDPVTPTVTRPRAGTVKVEAAAQLPAAIMHLFGFQEFDLEVECEASQNFVNTDVVLVLDVTGSMDAYLDGTKMIVALREAVMALYNELEPVQTQLQTAGMRLRYGIVPYSSSVNVGGLIRGVNPSYLADSWTYQSRSPIFGAVTNTQTYSNLTNDQCNYYRRSRYPYNSYPSTEKRVYRPGYGDRRDCVVVTITYSEEPSAGSEFAHWLHEPVVHNTSQFKLGGSVLLPTRVPGTQVYASPWKGCIEERQTDNTITGSSGYTIPSGAYDLNINHIPDSEATRWKPFWPEVAYYRPNTSGTSYSHYDSEYRQFVDVYGEGAAACPAAAAKLKAWTKSEMQSYVNNLEPVGGTYHDIGMIWGARLISGGGIFGSDNPVTHNGMPVAKHIIFMTDGQLAPNDYTYTSYGTELKDRRVTGSGNIDTQRARHEQRFKMICRAAKAADQNVADGREIFIWVIAFGTTTTAALEECASSPSHISTSTNRDQLVAKFTEIGKNIGALRLTQ